MNTFLTEIRETLAPGRSDRFGPLPPLLVAMTADDPGSSTSLQLPAPGSRLRRQHDGQRRVPRVRSGRSPRVLRDGVAGGAGVVRGGSVLGGRIVARFGHHRGHHVAVATATQSLLLAASMILALVGSNPFGPGVRYALIVALSVAMGVQNSTVRRLAVPDLTTTVLTLTVTGIGADGALGGGNGSKSGRRLIFSRRHVHRSAGGERPSCSTCTSPCHWSSRWQSSSSSLR